VITLDNIVISCKRNYYFKCNNASEMERKGGREGRRKRESERFWEGGKEEGRQEKNCSWENEKPCLCI
jgi:hypothetical protein